MSDITSADVAISMTIEDLYPQGFVLEQFGADSALTADAVQELETRMSVDGKLQAGYTPAPKVVNLTLQPTSPSIDYLKTLAQAQRTQLRPFEIGMVVRVRATGETFTYSRGYLTSVPPMPAVGKTLQELVFGFTFESVE
jgi:hypothetical protein